MGLSLTMQGYSRELKKRVNTVPGLAMHADGERMLISWEETMQKTIEAEFDRIKSTSKSKGDMHTRHAELDFKLFLSRYLHMEFADKTSATATVRDGPKPKEPVTLCLWHEGNKLLAHDILALVPASHPDRLHMKRFSIITHVIGWDLTAVDTEIARLKEKERREKKREEAEARESEKKELAEKEGRWERRCMRPHRELVAKAQSRPADQQSRPSAFLICLDHTACSGTPTMRATAFSTSRRTTRAS